MRNLSRKKVDNDVNCVGLFLRFLLCGILAAKTNKSPVNLTPHVIILVAESATSKRHSSLLYTLPFGGSGECTIGSPSALPSLREPA